MPCRVRNTLAGVEVGLREPRMNQASIPLPDPMQCYRTASGTSFQHFFRISTRSIIPKLKVKKAPRVWRALTMHARSVANGDNVGRRRRLRQLLLTGLRQTFRMGSRNRQQRGATASLREFEKAKVPSGLGHPGARSRHELHQR